MNCRLWPPAARQEAARRPRAWRETATGRRTSSVRPGRPACHRLTLACLVCLASLGLLCLLCLAPRAACEPPTGVASGGRAGPAAAGAGAKLPPGATCLLKSSPARPGAPVPAPSASQQAAANQGPAQPLKLVRASGLHDSLVQLSQNSVQYVNGSSSAAITSGAAAAAGAHNPSGSGSSAPGGANQNQANARHQVAFQSLCGGWRNSLQANEPKPFALWAYDEFRSALVAKFIFYAHSEFIDVSSREARLTSPAFRPIPAYHSMRDSPYHLSCNVSFSSYLTISAHLELQLYVVPSVSGARANKLAAQGQQQQQQRAQANLQQQQQPHLLKSIVPSKSQGAKERAQEASMWHHHQVPLPTGLRPDAYYVLEFSAMPGLISSGSLRQQSYLNGLAISNISLSAPCFGLDVDESELARVSSLTGGGAPGVHGASDSSTELAGEEDPSEEEERQTSSRFQLFVGQLLDTHKTAIFVLVLLLLAVVLVSTQYLVCVYHSQAHKGGFVAKGEEGQRANESLWSRLVCCWCCLVSWRGLSAAGGVGGRHQRVYAANMNGRSANSPNSGLAPLVGATSKLKELSGDCCAAQRTARQLYLPTALFEDMELTVNPNYLSAAPAASPGAPPAWSAPLNGARPTVSPNTPLGQLQQYAIDRKLLTLTKPLGKGAFGEVYQGYLICYFSYEDPAANSNLMDTESSGGSRWRFETASVGFDPLAGHSSGDLDHLESHSRKVAVKTLTDERMNQEDFIREAINMAMVRHRNIVELIGVCMEERPLYIVMELLQGGNLKNFLIKNRDKGYYHGATGGGGHSPANQINQSLIQLSAFSLSPAANHYQNPPQAAPAPKHQQKHATGPVRLCMGDLLVFALDIARACDYLQKHQFIHRDLAARNCLLTASSKLAPSVNRSPSARWQLRRADELDSSSSSLSSISVANDPIAVQQSESQQSEQDQDVDLDQVYLDGYAGSGLVAKLADFGMTRGVNSYDYYRMNHKEMPVRWVPPECLDGVATTKSDVWSYGVFLWELFSMGQLPYQDFLDNRQVIEFIKSRRVAKPRTTSFSAQQHHVAANGQQKLRPVPPLASARHRIEGPLLSISDDNVAEAGGEVPTPGEGHLKRPESLLPRRRLAPPPPQPQTPLPAGQLLEADENEAADSPPLPRPHDNTPDAIYSIMCDCWASNPEDRPQFEAIAKRLYWCLQAPEVLGASLPCFYEQHTPNAGQAGGSGFGGASSRPKSRASTGTGEGNSGAVAPPPTQQLNW